MDLKQIILKGALLPSHIFELLLQRPCERVRKISPFWRTAPSQTDLIWFPTIGVVLAVKNYLIPIERKTDLKHK